MTSDPSPEATKLAASAGATTNPSRSLDLASDPSTRIGEAAKALWDSGVRLSGRVFHEETYHNVARAALAAADEAEASALASTRKALTELANEWERRFNLGRNGEYSPYKGGTHATGLIQATAELRRAVSESLSPPDPKEPTA